MCRNFRVHSPDSGDRCSPAFGDAEHIASHVAQGGEGQPFAVPRSQPGGEMFIPKVGCGGTVRSCHRNSASARPHLPQRTQERRQRSSNLLATGAARNTSNRFATRLEQDGRRDITMVANIE